MTGSHRVTLLIICFIMAGLTGSVATGDGPYDKSVTVSLHIDHGTILVTSMDIRYGSAPNYFPMQGDFRGELVAADGSVVKTFSVWDPRIQFGDEVAGSPADPTLRGVVDRRDIADTVVIFPFYPQVTGFRLYNAAEGTLLASVDMKPRIDRFFAAYPNDPENPALYESAAVSPLSPGPTGITNQPGPLSREFWGILSIGSGALLILAGILASFRLIRPKPRSILVVDDDPDVAEVIAKILTTGSYMTRVANSGKECLDLIGAAVPDLILLDIGMEPMDGWETLRRIKQNPSTKGILVIMLTARRLTPKDVEDYAICIEDYIVKPVTPQNLKDAISHVFTRQLMIREQIEGIKGAGIDREELCECARLTRVVDVNKRLWETLVRTNTPEPGMTGAAGDETTRKIRYLQGTFREQEHRLEQIRQKIGSRRTA